MSLVFLLLALSCAASPKARLDRDDNGLWARRVWLHEAHTDAEIDGLVATLRARGITQLYPFLGPPDAEGHPSWRDGEVPRPVDPVVASAFLTRMKARAPEIAVYPWTGGVFGRDIAFAETARLDAWRAAVLSLPVSGVQLNIEPMPEQEAYLDLLRAWKKDLGDRTLSIAAYPPPMAAQAAPEVHWSPEFLRQVCEIADDLAVMAYDTSLRSAADYSAVVADWTRTLAALPPPEQGGCTVRIGVPAYEDVAGWHDPNAETLAAALAGVHAGLGASAPAHVRGVALYASWTMDDADWATYDRDWRGREAVQAALVDVTPG